MLEGTERVLHDGGPSLVETCFADAKGLKNHMGNFVGACHDEWLDRAGVDPAVLEEFLEYRVDNLETLAQKGHWLGLASFDPGGQRVFDIG